MPIRIKLTIFVLALVLIPLSVAGLVTFSHYQTSLKNSRLMHLQELARFKAERIELYFSNLNTTIAMAQNFYNVRKNLPVLLKHSSGLGSPETAAARKMLDEQLRPTQKVLELADIMLADTAGTIVYASNPDHTARALPVSLPRFSPDRAGNDSGNIGFSSMFVNRMADNQPEMLITAPVSDLDDNHTGFIIFEIDRAVAYRIIEDTSGLGQSGEILIGKKSGTDIDLLNPLRNSPAGQSVLRVHISDPIGLPIQKAIAGESGTGESVDYRGKKVVAAWRYIPSLDWGLVAKIDRSEEYAAVTKLKQSLFIIMALVLVLIIVITLVVAQSFARPIEQLIRGTEIIGSGNLAYRVGTSGRDEIGRLSRSFDRMAEDLKLITASHDELDQEIKDRRRAEEDLKRSNKELADSRKAALNLMDDALLARKEAERSAMELRKSREDLNRAQAVASIGSWRLDLWNNTLTWSDENYRIFHVKPGTPLSFESFLAIVHPDDRELVEKKWNAAVGGASYDIEHRIVVDGEVRWVGETAYMEFDENGVLRSGFGTTQDITGRKKLETELAEKSRQLENLVRKQKAEIVDTRESLYIETKERLRVEDELDHRQQALEAVYAISTAFDTSFAAMNDQVVLSIAKILEAPYVVIHHLAEGKTVLSSRLYNGTLSHDTGDDIAACIGRMKDRPQGVSHSTQCQQCFRQGEMRSYAGAPLFNRHGEVRGVICVLDSRERVFDEYDIRLIEIFARYLSHEQTERDLETQLLRSNEMRVLGQLTSGVAHEVRNPLNGIMAIMSALAKELSDDERFKPYLTHMENQVIRLTGLMEDLLALGRPIREEKKTLIPVVELVANALATWQQSVRGGRELRFVKPGDAGDATVHAEGVKITQALINLMENAHQHTPEGLPIDLVVELPDDAKIRISVKDNGPGIPDDIMPRVFEPFFTTRKGGTGLGLSIVRHIVESHGGSIAVGNNEGGPGTTFTIELPLAPVAV